MMLITAYMSARKGYGKERDKAPTFKELVLGFKEGILALTMTIIIGGIVGGIVTATEASALAVF